MTNALIIIATIIISAVLWHAGGQGPKFARVLVGGVIGLAKSIMLWNPLALVYWLALWIMTSLFSYGLSAPPHKFWVWVFRKGGEGNYPPVEIATRATCGLAWSLAAVVFALLTGNWITFAICSILTTIGVTFFGLRKNVKVSELGTGASVAASILI